MILGQPSLFSNSEIIGKIYPYEVRHFQREDHDVYGLVLDGKTCCWVMTKPFHDMEELVGISVMPEYNKIHLAENLLFWLKTHLKKDLVSNQAAHSVEWRKYISKSSRFKQYWLNIRTGEKYTYDPEKEYEFHKWESPSEWKLVIEHKDGENILETLRVWSDYQIDLLAHMNEPPISKG
jgi:hypothetical protein